MSVNVCIISICEFVPLFGILQYLDVNEKKIVIFFKLFKKRFNFIYFWLRWVFIAACGLSLVAPSGDYSLLQCAGFSLQWLLLLRSTSCTCAGFSSYGTLA